MAANRARREALLRNPRIQQFLIANVKSTGKKLGHGAYGNVEELEIDGALCAGKKIHETLLEEGNANVENLVRKYVEECQLLSSLGHPNIVQFIGLCFFPESTLPVLVMELLLTSLDHLLKNTPDIPLALKRSMLADVAKGLAYLHNRNPPIVHRDLSAKNVLLNSAMMAKISDMGNSRIVPLQQLSTTLSHVPGTLTYMPPEAFDTTSQYGPALDTFSFGVVALFTLTQEFPGNLRPHTYPDPTNMDRLLARTEVERRGEYIDALHSLLGEKHSLVQLVKECLRNIPERRPTANVLIQQLAAVHIDDTYQHLTRVDALKLLRQKDDELQKLQLTVTDKKSQNQLLKAQILHKDADIGDLQGQLQRTDTLLHQIDEELGLLRSRDTSQSPPKVPTVDQVVNQRSKAEPHSSVLQQKQEPEISEATDKLNHTDEISVANQRMLKARVVRQNFTYLYQHLAVADILPKLVEKGIITEAKRKEVEAYSQKCAQNIVVASALFFFECPPDVLVRLTDVLAMTSGQEQVARKLLDAYNHLSRKVPSPDVPPGPTLTTSIPSDFSELSQMFQQTLHSIMNAFDDIPKILEVLKEIFHSLVLPLGEGKVASLVEVASYQHAQTHREVFRLMSPYWNCLSTDLLQFLIEASGCSLAATKLSEFVQARSSQGHLVVCCSQDAGISQQIESSLDASISPSHRSVHTGPLEAPQCLHPSVFARLPEHKIVASRNTVRITAEVNMSLFSLSDYEAVTAAISAAFELPRQALVYAGCSVNPTVLCWLVSADIVPYIKSANVGLSSNRLLAEHNISGFAVGGVISYKCPSMKEVELWEASAYGQTERVCDLLQSVNVDATDIIGWTALLWASQKEHKEVAALLLSAKANVNHQDNDGWTALLLACQNGHKEVAALLLSAKANVNHQDNEGFTALHWACQNGHTAVVSLLLEHAADLHLTSNKGACATPLMLACFKGRSEVVNVLLEAGADINQLSGRWKMTALMFAAHEGHLETLNTLIQGGADIHMKNEDGKTALDLARHNGHREICQVLSSHK